MMVKKVLNLGCGFLSSHYIPHLIPHVEEIILVDREKVEQVNYDNYILFKDYVGRRKVTAFNSFIQSVSNIRSTPRHLDIRRVEQLFELHDEVNPDLVIVGFDNVRAKMIARDYARAKNVPAIFAGVTENYIYIDWENAVILPDGRNEDEVRRIEESMSMIRDICSRLEFRGLGAISGALVYKSFVEYIDDESKMAYVVSFDKDGNINIKQFNRKSFMVNRDWRD